MKDFPLCFIFWKCFKAKLQIPPLRRRIFVINTTSLQGPIRLVMKNLIENKIIGMPQNIVQEGGRGQTHVWKNAEFVMALKMPS